MTVPQAIAQNAARNLRSTPITGGGLPATYPARVLAQTPTYYWRLTSTADAGSGAITLTNNNSVPFSGRPTLVVDDSSGGSGSFSAAATPGHFKASSILSGVTNLTYLVACQPDKLLTKHVMFNLEQSAAIGSDYLGIELVDNGAGGLTPRIYRWTGTALWIVQGASGVAFPVGSVGHLAVVFNATNGSIQCYIDGVAIALTTTSGSQPASWPAIGSSANAYIGCYKNGTAAPFDGLMAEVAIIPRALDAQTVADLHNSTRKVSQVVYMANFSAGTLTGTGSIDPAAQVTTHPAVGLTAVRDSTPTSGSITASGGVFNFNDSTAANGADSFTGHVTKSAVSSSTVTVSLTWSVAAQLLPRTPDMSFLASDGTIPGGTVRYAKVGGTGVGGSTEGTAGDLQTTINSTTAGQTVVVLGGNYNLPNGLVFPNNGSSGNVITIMAKPGDTAIIDKAVEFATYRIPSTGLSTKWELFDNTKKIWRSVATTFGTTVRPLGGVWYEGGWPHYILPCDSLTHLQAADGLSNIWTNYGGPCALVHTDGRIYLRFERPFAGKMSVHNKWPTDGRMDYVPGWVSKGGSVTAGQLAFPLTQDPRDYQIWLAHSPGGGAGGKVAFDLRNRSWVTIGDGINSFGYGISYYTGGATNITFKRGTDYSLQYGLVPTATSSAVTFQRRRMTHGCIHHQPLVQWKFGGPLEANWRGAFFPWSGGGIFANSYTFTDCTFHGWHDFATGMGANWKIQNCAFIQIMDDGFQVVANAFTGLNLHYCYFLDSVFGGPDQSGVTGLATYISHCIFDQRCPRIVDCANPQGEPFAMPMYQTHLTGRTQWPHKIYNCTFIVPPDCGGGDSFYINHMRGDEPNNTAPTVYHELFNNIWVRCDYQRYLGNGGQAWTAQSDEMVGRVNCGGNSSKEAYDYEIFHRDVPGPLTAYFHDLVDSAIGGGTAAGHGGAGYTSLANWLAGNPSYNAGIANKFNKSKTVYAPGFWAHAFQVNPRMPSCPTGGVVPDFDTRRNYRPLADEASSGYRSTNANSPAGEAFSGWSANAPKWDNWIGALDPTSNTMPVGVQNP